MKCLTWWLCMTSCVDSVTKLAVAEHFQSHQLSKNLACNNQLHKSNNNIINKIWSSSYLKVCSHKVIRLIVISSLVNVQSRCQLEEQVKKQFKLETKYIQVFKWKCKYVLNRFSSRNDFQWVCVCLCVWLRQVTNTRTMAHECDNHMVGVTADKNIIWPLEQSVDSCSGLSWIRIRYSSRLLNIVVNEIWSSFIAAHDGHCD